LTAIVNWEDWSVQMDATMAAARSAGRRRALVTGASAGIGAAFAERLARDGYDLVLVARRRDRLEQLARRLHDEQGAAVQVVVADLTRAAELGNVEQMAAADPSLELLVNNAGFAGYMPFVQLDPDRAEELIRLHVVAVTRLTRAALPGMLARDRGAIINVASMLAFSASLPATSPLPKRVVYAACKAYLVAFTEALHQELAGTNVRMQALCPGRVGDTEFHQNLPGFDPTRSTIPAFRTEDVVTASLAALGLGDVLCSPGLEDPALIEQYRASERQLLAGSLTGRLAERYRLTKWR
jgi:uncharacterized protein